MCKGRHVKPNHRAPPGSTRLDATHDPRGASVGRLLRAEVLNCLGEAGARAQVLEGEVAQGEASHAPDLGRC